MTGSIKPECRFIVGRQLEFELELKWLCSHLVPDTAAARRLLTLFCLPSRRRVWLAGWLSSNHVELDWPVIGMSYWLLSTGCCGGITVSGVCSRRRLLWCFGRLSGARSQQIEMTVEDAVVMSPVHLKIYMVGRRRDLVLRRVLFSTKWKPRLICGIGLIISMGQYLITNSN